MRYLGIDYGTKKIGLALSDESGTLAFPYIVIKNDGSALEQLVQVIEEKTVDEVVIGESLNTNGQPNAVQSAINELVTDLTLQLGLPVHLEPEQFTTQAALQTQGRHELTDASAAALILDTFIQKQSRTS